MHCESLPGESLPGESLTFTALLQVAQLLLDYGQDLNMFTTGRYWYHYNGTSLKLAAERGSLDYVDMLLNAGADPDLYGMI